MKIIKKVMLILTGMALVACNSTTKTDTSSTDETQKSLLVAVDTMYVDYINTIKEKFEESTGVKVVVKEEAMTEIIEKLPTDGPTGAAPDVFIAPYDRVGKLGSEGQIALVTLGNDEQYDDTVKSLVTVNGNIYGAPFVIETLVLYYNKDLLSAVPSTFEELEAIQKEDAYVFESEAGKSVGFLANWTNFYYAYGLIAGYDGYVFGDDGTNPKDIGLANDGTVQALRYAKQWYDMWPQGMQDTTKAGDFITLQFTQGKTAAIIDGPWASASLKESGLNLGVSTIPTLVNGGKYEAFGGGKAWVVSNYSAELETAQLFLDYITNEENQKILYDSTHEVPANVVAREYAVAQGDELTTAVIEQFASAQPMPNIPEMIEVWEPAANMFFDVASGKKDAATASQETTQLIQEAIEQKYAE